MASTTESINLPTVGLRGERIFYSGMACAVLLIVAVGFGRSYYFRSFTDLPSLPALVHIHASFFSAWVLLFCVQTTLVAAGRTDVHRRLGIVGGVLAIVMIILGYETAVYGARHGWNPGGPFRDSLSFMLVGLSDMINFAVFVLGALWFRRRREVHKRLMLLALIGGLLWPAITRLPYVAPKLPLMFGVLTLFVLAGPLFDFISRRRVHPVYIWGGLLILGTMPARVALASSEAWHSFAAWLIS